MAMAVLYKIAGGGWCGRGTSGLGWCDQLSRLHQAKRRMLSAPAIRQ